MITEERLQEMELSPREACIARLEMQELAHAYRVALRVLAGKWLPCKGKNCAVTDGISHSVECRMEHNATTKGQP